MLTWLALAMLTTFMILVMSRRVSVLVALILPPVVFGLIGGFGSELGPMVLEGLTSLAPTGIMLCFAILYFCIMSDAGLFDPLIRAIVRLVRADPLRVVVGTAILALVVSLDGDGATTYLICCTAMLPIYRRLGLDPLILATLLVLACGITNITPWGGPTAVAASALKLDASDIFVPMLPAMLAGAACVLMIAYFLGLKERRRIGAGGQWKEVDVPADPSSPGGNATPEQDALRRPQLFAVNLTLTGVLIAALVLEFLPLPMLFMVAASLALVFNYPTVKVQKERLAAHAPSIFPVIAVIFGAGVFVGILNGTGMSAALAQHVVGLIPPGWRSAMTPITGLLSVPFAFVMSNKAYFYGVIPVVAQAAGHYGIPSVEIARAALTAQAVHLLSPVVPSTYLLVTLAQVEFGALQRFAFKWALLVSIVLLATTLATTLAVR